MNMNRFQLLGLLLAAGAMAEAPYPDEPREPDPEPDDLDRAIAEEADFQRRLAGLPRGEQRRIVLGADDLARLDAADARRQRRAAKALRERR